MFCTVVCVVVGVWNIIIGGVGEGEMIIGSWYMGVGGKVGECGTWVLEERWVGVGVGGKVGECGCWRKNGLDCVRCVSNLLVPWCIFSMTHSHAHAQDTKTSSVFLHETQSYARTGHKNKRKQNFLARKPG